MKIRTRNMKFFKCNDCGKQFETLNGLRIHQGMVHNLNHKDKECPYCGKQFTQRSGVLGHIREEHKDKLKYKCPICSPSSENNQFDTVRGLRTHLSMEHKEIWRKMKMKNNGVQGVKGEVLPKDFLNASKED